MGLKLIVILLAVIDFALLGYVIYYYQEIYKKGIERVDNIIKKAKNKFEKNNLFKLENRNENNHQISVREKVAFEEDYNNLSIDQKDFYKEITEYVLTYKKVNIVNNEFDSRIKYGKRNILASISIKNNLLVVKIKMGSLKLKDQLESLQLKPIKIVIKTHDDVLYIQQKFDIAYNNLIGTIDVNMEGDNNNE